MLYRVLITICFFLLFFFPAAVAQDFRVQIAAYADSMPQIYFKNRGLEKVLVSTDQMGLYRYFVGTYDTREQAEAVLEQVVAKGFPNAVIIDLEEQRALGGAVCPYNRPNRPIFLQKVDEKTTAYYIYFDTGIATLSPEARREVDLVAQAMKANPRLFLKIIGQTDGIGTPLANQELATNRARSARDYLLDKGIRTSRITIKVYGEAEAELINKEEGEDGKDLPGNRKWNRRVVLGLSEVVD